MKKTIFLLTAAIMATIISSCSSGNTAFWDSILEKYAADPDVKQIMLIKCTKGCEAESHFYVKDEAGKWELVRSSDAQLGKNGLGKQKEGDMMTPEGDFGIRCAYGILPNPGTSIEYVDVTESVYGCSDEGPFYNRIIDTALVHHECHGEHMIEIAPDYNYGMAIDYNPDQTYGLGNSIFLHAKGKFPYTEGCVAIDEDFMKEVLVKSDKNFRICIYRK